MDGSVFGSFAIYHREPRVPDPRDLELVERATHLAGITLEQHRKEEDLRKSESKWRSLVETIPDHVAVYDNEGRYEFLNHYAEGYSAKDIVGKHYSGFLPEASRLLYDQAIGRIKSTGTTQFLEYVAPGDKGSTRFYDSYIVPMFQDGTLTNFMVIARDITERKLVEEERKRALDLSQKVFHSSPLPTVLSRLPERIVIDANEAFMSIFGYTRPEVIGRPISELDLWADSIDRDAVANILLRDGNVANREFVYKTKSGQTGTALFYAEMFEQGAERFVLTKILDITERKRAVQALRESEERLRLSTELAHVAVWEYDVRTNSMSRSRNHDELYGLEWQSSWAFETFLNATHPDDRQYSASMIQASVAPGGSDHYSFDFRVIDAKRSIRWLNVVGQVIERNSKGEGQLVRGCLLDISGRKEAEEEVRRSREQLRVLANHLQTLIDEERARIAREIHDDIGQILTATKMDLSLFSRTVSSLKDRKAQLTLQNEIRALVALLDRGTQSIRKIIRDLRPEVLETIGLFAGIKWQVDEFKKRTKLSVSLSLPKKEPMFEKQASLALFRSIQETLTNVAKHARAKNVRIVMNARSKALRLTVSDDGRGISEADLTRPESFGLLAMRERILALGGTLAIHGEPNKGTVIDIELPQGQES
jgi:two-component system sensor histidine kinase UhpB